MQAENRGGRTRGLAWGISLVFAGTVMQVPVAPSATGGVGGAKRSAPLHLEHTLTLFDPAITPEEHPEPLLFSADGRLLFARARGANTILGWQLPSARVIFERRCDGRPKDFIEHLALTPDSRYLITAGISYRRDPGGLGQIIVWELLTGRQAKQWTAGGRQIFGLGCDRCGKRFATTGLDDFVRLWDFPDCKEVGRFRCSGGYVAFVPPGNKLLVAAKGGLEIWDADGGKMLPLAQAKDNSYSLGLSAEGKKVAAALWSDRSGPAGVGKAPLPPEGVYWIRLWDVGTGKKLADLDHEDVLWVAFHPDGRHLLSIALGAHADLVCWDLTGQRRVARWRLPARPTQAALSPSGDRLATAHMDGTVRVWRIPWEKLP